MSDCARCEEGLYNVDVQAGECLACGRSLTLTYQEWRELEPIVSTDWDKELDLLSEYMDYYIERISRYGGYSAVQIIEIHQRTGMMVLTDQREVALTFENWKNERDIEAV